MSEQGSQQERKSIDVDLKGRKYPVVGAISTRNNNRVVISYDEGEFND